VAWRVGGQTTYALEGSAFVAGAAVQWLRDGLGLIKKASEIEKLAESVPSSEDVSFVPALAGLGAPYWDQGARGAIVGLTRGTTAAHIARATLEGIALEVWDLLGAMAQDASRPITGLRVDGGAAANNLLMQFQADVADLAVERPTEIESTGRGAAMLAGVGAGLATTEAAKKMLRLDRRFEPKMGKDERARHVAKWKDAVRRSRSS
jgi:glycerol kinase